MYRWLLILFLFIGAGGMAQTYNSPYSIHVPTGEKENIFRKIYIREEVILIKSYINGVNVDNQLMIIESTEHNNNATTYKCVSPDGIFPTLITIDKHPTYISVIQPRNSTIEEYQLYLEVLQ